MQGSLSIEQMCRLSGVSRTGFYCSLQERMPVEEDMEVRSAIQQIAVEPPAALWLPEDCGRTAAARMLANHKRVARIMREDNLLAVQPRAFVVTTDSQHALEVYLNLGSAWDDAERDQSALGGGYHLYPAGHREFVYLAVILDAWSRKVVGWELDRTLAARLAIGSAGESHRGAKAASGLPGAITPTAGVAVCQRRLRETPAQARDDPKHEPAGESFPHIVHVPSKRRDGGYQSVN